MAKKNDKSEVKAEEQKDGETLEKGDLVADSSADSSEVADTADDTDETAEDVAEDESSDIPDHIAVEDGGVVMKGAIYKLSAKHPTGSYWRGGVQFKAGEEVTVYDGDWSVEQIEELLNDPWLECVQVIPMSKDEYDALKAQGGK